MRNLITRGLIASAAIAAMIGLAPVAHADPSYAGPHCSPTATDYNSIMCSELPQNDSACDEFGDHAQCISDWIDYQDRQHELYTSTQN